MGDVPISFATDLISEFEGGHLGNIARKHVGYLHSLKPECGRVFTACYFFVSWREKVKYQLQYDKQVLPTYDNDSSNPALKNQCQVQWLDLRWYISTSFQSSYELNHTYKNP